MKIGIYFCNCGPNISDKVDSERVKEKVARLPDVVYFKTVDFICSEEGKTFLENDLRENMPGRVVIAACSPREHENTFMRMLSKAGINPNLMQMVNIREQVDWDTADREKATEKASAYIRGAIARVRHHEPLEKIEMDVCPDVIVIGAGPAGLKAALSLAEAGS